MKKRNKKGFTLIELLAVIVILAVLLAIAIPKVTHYITRSRKDSMITTAKDLTRAVSKDATTEIYELPIGTDDITIVSLDLIELETGGKKSSFSGKWLNQYSYVAIINVGTAEDPDYEYYVALRDSKRYTITLQPSESLTRESIVRNNAAGTKAPISAMCGSKDGDYKVINNIAGLEKYKPINGWNATVYSSTDC